MLNHFTGVEADGIAASRFEGRSQGTVSQLLLDGSLNTRMEQHISNIEGCPEIETMAVELSGMLKRIEKRTGTDAI